MIRQNTKSKFIEENLKLVSFVAKKYIDNNNSYEDITSLGCVGLIKAVNSYDSSKNTKFSTYGVKCIENEILMYLRRTRYKEVCMEFIEATQDVTPFDSTNSLNFDSVAEEIIISEERQDVVNLVGKLKGNKREIISLRYGLFSHKPHTQKETAAILGVSQSYISITEKKIIEELKAKLLK